MGPGAENPLFASLLPNMAQQMQSVQLMPSGWCFIFFFMTESKENVLGFWYKKQLRRVVKSAISLLHCVILFIG